MKVINMYIVKGEISSYNEIVFECENNKWYLQKEILQNEYQTIIIEISKSKAKEIIASSLK